MTSAQPLHTTHRVFEPQLVSGLAWSIAGAVLVLGGPLGDVLPPELAVALGLPTALLLSGRLVVRRLASQQLRWMIVDPLRVVAYLAAVSLWCAAGIDGIVGVMSLPGCAVPGSIGTFELVDVVPAAGLALVVLVEPWIYGRSLIFSYLWPASPGAYAVRWSIRLAIPTLSLGVCALSHLVATPSSWTHELQARKLLRAVAQAPDARAVTQHLRAESQRLSESDQVELSREAVALAHCEDDPELWARLLGDPPAQAIERLELRRGIRHHAIAAYIASMSSAKEAP